MNIHQVGVLERLYTQTVCILKGRTEVYQLPGIDLNSLQDTMHRDAGHIRAV